MKNRCRSFAFVWVAMAMALSWLSGGNAAEEHLFYRKRPRPSRQLSEMVANVDMPHQERVDTLNRTVAGASPEDYADMAVWLEALVREQSAPHAIREQALRKLYHLGIHSEDILEYLVFCASDVNEDSEWRLVSLTALGQMHDMAAPADRQTIVKGLMAAAKDPVAAVAGHANLVLARTDRSKISADRRTATVFLTDDPETIVSALTLGAELGDSALLPQARAIIPDENLPFRLRLAAIHFLGVVGESGDRDGLLRYGAVDAILQSASEKACGAIMERLIDGGGVDDRGGMNNE